ncbi:MAG: DUF6265 family protein [Pseudomonadota bacterium]
MHRRVNRISIHSHCQLLALILLLAGVVVEAQPITTLPVWMAGCWISEDRQSLEVWTQDNPQTLIGFSSVVKDGRIGFYELMSIRLQGTEDGQEERGGLVFTAYPANQPGGSFPAIELDEQAVVFSNPAHDYPQRIRYRRRGDQLFADIALVNGDRLVEFDKKSCEALSP